jgi:hypothetical protein
LEPGSDEEAWCKSKHRENNTFGEEGGDVNPFGAGNGAEQADAGSYIEGEEVKVVLVRISDGRISDWKESVTDFVLEDGGDARGGSRGMVNGVGR